MRSRYIRAHAPVQKRGPTKTGGAKEARLLPPDFDVNAGATVPFSFSQLDTWFTMPVAFLNGDFLITPVTTDCHIRFSHTVFRARAGPTQVLSHTSAAPAGVASTAEPAKVAARVTHRPFAYWELPFHPPINRQRQIKNAVPKFH
jgi:hypothetical protein